MSEYGYLRTLFMSFYSRDLYRDIAKNWGAGVILYLLLLLTICWIVLSLRIQPVINVGFKQFADQVSPQLPNITIENGQLSTPTNEPVLIKAPEGNQVIAVIDPSGKYASLNDLPAGATVLVTKTEVMTKDTKTDSAKVYAIPATLNAHLNPEEVKATLTKVVSWSWLIFIPMLILFSLIYRLIQSLLYALLGKIYALIANVPVNYSTILKLTIVALTPAIVIGTILEFTGAMFPLAGLLYFVITLGYIIFAIRANKNS